MSIRSSGSPTGRRARLVGTGKDVWEIIAVVRDNDGDAAETARYLEIPLGLVQAAISYTVPPEVMVLARTKRRAVVTNNLRDYRPLHADAITPGGPGHFGMIFMPSTYWRTKEDAGRIIAAFEAKLTKYPGDEDLASWRVPAVARSPAASPTAGPPPPGTPGPGRQRTP